MENNPNPFADLVEKYGQRNSEPAPASQQMQPMGAAPQGENPFGDLIEKYRKPEAAAQPAPEQTANEAHPYLSSILSFATGADDAMLNLPSNAAAGLRALKNGTSFNQEYETVKKAGETAAGYSPFSYGAGIAGGVAAGMPFMPEAAPTMAGRALQGARIGGVMSGAGELADSKNPLAAIEAGVIGAGVGGVAAPVVETALNAAGAAKNAATNYTRGALDPEGEALRRVALARAADNAKGTALTPEQLAAAERNGQRIYAGDLGGEATRAIARSAANTSPEGRQLLQEATQDRFYTQNERVGNFMQGLGSGNAASDTREALQREARAANKPAYDAAFNHPNAQAVWDEDLARLAGAPDMRDALRGAIRTGENRAAIEGVDAVKNPFVFGEDGSVRLADPNVTPNLRLWDQAKRNLDDRISALGRSGEKSAQADAIELKSRLLEGLDKRVPEYAPARSGAAKYFGADDALTAGEKFVMATGGSITDARKAFAKMSAPERALFADGFASKYADTIRNTADRVNVLNKIGNSPEARQRIELALGKQRADELTTMLHVEHISDQLRQAVSGNSSTARQLVELGLAGGAGAAGLHGITSGDPTEIGALLLAVGRHKIDGRIAQKVAELLVSDDPKHLQQIARMAAKNERVGAWMKDVSTRFGGLTGQAVGRAAIE
jgi:hypothetical protein